MNVYKLILAVFVSATVSACSGGGAGGGNDNAVVISGVAAAGAPIVGAVKAKDSKGKIFGPASIGNNGKYSIAVTGGVAPYVLQASGVVGTVNVDVYSVASTTATNLNINPLTNLVVAQSTGSSPASVFSTCTDTSCGVPVQAKINLGQQQVQALLQTMLTQFGVTGTINFLTDAIIAGPVANQSPLDKMLDVVNIQPVSAGSASFEIKPNSVSGLSTTLVLVTVPAPVAGGVTTVTTVPLVVDPALSSTVINTATTALTSLQSIQSQFDVLTNLISTTKPSASDATLAALIDTNFKNWGGSKTGFINKLSAANGIALGSTYTGVVAAAPRNLPAPATAIPNDSTHQWFTFVFTAPGQASQTNGPWLAIKDGASGKWLIAGNQMPTPSFVGNYSSSTLMDSGFTHTESNTVSGATVSGNHTFVNASTSSTGSFVWTGTITTSTTDNRSGTISGTVTINNLGTRTASMTGGVYMQNNGSVHMWWNATDPTYGPIGGCSSTTGEFWCPASGSSTSGGGSSSGGGSTPPSSIVGTWTMSQYQDASPAFISLVLLADSRFMLLSANNGGCQAMEAGTYSYNTSTSALSLSVTYDTSASCGLLQGGAASVAAPAIVSYTFTTGGALSGPGVSGAFTKNTVTSSEIGTWLFEANAGGDFNILINHPDGRFMYAEAPTVLHPNAIADGRGLEYGTYSATSTSYTFSTLTYDGNGSTSGINAVLGTSMTVTTTDVTHAAIITPDAVSHPAVRQ